MLSKKNRPSSRSKTAPITRLRQVHTYLGLFASLFLLILAFSGLYLNHQETFSGPKTTPLSDALSALSTCSDGTLLLGSASGLFSSRDQGRSLQPLSLPYPAQHIADVHCAPGHLFVLQKNGVLFHSTSPQSPMWKRLPLPLVNGEFYRFRFSKPNTLYVYGHQGLYLSQNWGKDWTLLHPNIHSSSFSGVMKALHTGYYRGQWLLFFNDVSTVILILLIVTGIWIYLRVAIRNYKAKR